MASLAGKVCLVTGATRGIGKGIAVQLAEAGATVYVTGRTLRKIEGSLGSLEETAAEITNRGKGKCIPVQCDHSNDDDIKKLFDRISSEQDGRLDVLVNNAYSAVTVIAQVMEIPFWEQPLSIWDDVNNVGLRNHYMCAVHAAKLMVPRREGLIVNVSSPGGLTYLFNVSYGIGKAACDRMAADCAKELRKHNVAFVSLWPNAVMTEVVNDLSEKGSSLPPLFQKFAETSEFAGRAVAYLAADPEVMKKSGRTLMTGDLGDEYGFNDVDGRSPASFRSLGILLYESFPTLSGFLPKWIKMPRWILAVFSSKF